MDVPEADITLVPGPRTTYQDARFSLPILTRRGAASAVIVSDPFHLPRVRWTFRHIFKGSPIRLLFAASEDASVPPDWWKKEKSRNIVFLEMIKNIYYRFYYNLLGLESEPPWILEWKAAVKRFFGSADELHEPQKAALFESGWPGLKKNGQDGFVLILEMNCEF